MFKRLVSFDFEMAPAAHHPPSLDPFTPGIVRNTPRDAFARLPPFDTQNLSLRNFSSASYGDNGLQNSPVPSFPSPAFNFKYISLRSAQYTHASPITPSASTADDLPSVPSSQKLRDLYALGKIKSRQTAVRTWELQCYKYAFWTASLPPWSPNPSYPTSAGSPSWSSEAGSPRFSMNSPSIDLDFPPAEHFSSAPPELQPGYIPDTMEVDRPALVELFKFQSLENMPYKVELTPIKFELPLLTWFQQVVVGWHEGESKRHVIAINQLQRAVNPRCLQPRPRRPTGANFPKSGSETRKIDAPFLADGKKFEHQTIYAQTRVVCISWRVLARNVGGIAPDMSGGHPCENQEAEAVVPSPQPHLRIALKVEATRSVGVSRCPVKELVDRCYMGTLPWETRGPNPVIWRDAERLRIKVVASPTSIASIVEWPATVNFLLI
ncbi:hypothetical protein C8R47DRAFT_1079208 [Mycena vitilis]|nr:hypothetical protein C8R47DRAFT_1079208 [Mycena vitilis]